MILNKIILIITIAREISNTDSYKPNGYLELQYAYDIARKRGINSSTYSIRYDNKGYKVLDYIDDNFTDYQTIDKIPEDEVKALYYNNVNNKLGKLLSKNYRKYVEKQFNKQYRKAINKEIAKWNY